MKSLLLISLIALFTVTFANNTFASTTKSDACNYKEGTYGESLETTWLKNALVTEFRKIDYYDHNELWYIVRQTGTNTSSKITKDDYSLYSYNCKTRTPKRVFWQLIFRLIVEKLPDNLVYRDARILFIGGNYIEVWFFPNSGKCTNLKDTCDKNSYYRVNISYYRVSIGWDHTFSISKPAPDKGKNEYQFIWRYKY